MKKTILTAMLFLLASCGLSDNTEENNVNKQVEKESLESSPVSDVKSDITLCIERGIQYFKDIDSYPLLKSSVTSGQQADKVAEERCNRTTTAF